MQPSSDSQPPPTALARHILPVIAGVVVTIALTVVTDSWLAARGVVPALSLPAAYRGLFTVLGGHLAARLAPAGQPRIRYAMALAVLLTVMNVIGALTYGGQTQVPAWYLLLGIALPLPCAIIGGATAARAMARQVEPREP